MLREASGFVKDGDRLCMVLGPYSLSGRRAPTLSSEPSTTPPSRPSSRAEELHLSQAGAHAYPGARAQVLSALGLAVCLPGREISRHLGAPSAREAGHQALRGGLHLQAQEGSDLLDEPHGQPPCAGAVPCLPAFPELSQQH